jgi:uncharacterized protein YndB with AHSA1/START domain
MFTAENVITIQRPVAEVFAYATDPTKLHEWRPMVLEIIGYEPPLRLGTTYELAEKLMGRQQFGQRIVTYEPDRLVVIETTSGGVRPTQRFTFEPTSDGGTRYTAHLDIRTYGVMRIFEPLMRGRVRKTMVAYGENLKRNLESMPRQGQPTAQPVS